MDDVMAKEVQASLEFEKLRTAPPAGFPKLPDIPLARYTSESFFETEIKEIFKKNWLFAGHESEVPNPGSYRVLDIPFAPVLIVRGKDGVLRGFLNSCRHRGAPVVRDVHGEAKLLVCQFHSWSYDLCGNLVRIPEERDFFGIQPSERSLPSLRVETWHGLIFINLDNDAPPLSEWLAPVISRYSDLAESPLRFIRKFSYDIPCNWKVATEAFLEVYHVKTVHPHTAAQISEPFSSSLVLHPNGHSSQYMRYKDEIMSGPADSMIFQVMFPSDLPVSPTAHEAYSKSVVVFSIFPNLVSPVDPKGFPVAMFWPVSVNETRFEIYWYGVDWGDGPVPEGWEVKLGAWEVVMDEDIQNMAPIQRSLRAAAHTGVPLSYQERLIYHLHAEIDRRIGRDRVPEELHVPALLDDYIEP